MRLRRLGEAVREESFGFSPRLHLGLAVVAGLPDLTGVRLRATVLRWSGVAVGPDTVIGGRIRIAGGPTPGRTLSIGARGWVNAGCYFDTSDRITIGDDAAIGQQVLVLTQSHRVAGHGRRAGPLTTAPVTIGDGCWIGARAVLLPGVTVGDGAIVAAGAVVTRDVEPDTMVAGTPARVVKHLPADVPGVWES